MQVFDDITEEEKVALAILAGINDPEIPVLSIIDLGIVRKVTIRKPGEHIEVSITPTYSGCPAMDVLRVNIRVALLSHGYREVQILNVLSPAWTTDWMSANGKQKLKEYGIAPPMNASDSPAGLFQQPAAVTCPLCESTNTFMISEFGSTSCKALYQCKDCKEPFDVFKCH